MLVKGNPHAIVFDFYLIFQGDRIFNEEDLRKALYEIDGAVLVKAFKDNLQACLDVVGRIGETLQDRFFLGKAHVVTCCIPLGPSKHAPYVEKDVQNDGEVV